MRFSNTLAIGFAALAAVVSAATFTNPLKNPNGSDPFIVYDGGYYYLTTTTWTDIQVTRATTLEGLKTGENKVVWEDSNTDRCCQVWAPEMHSIDGTWYMYYTAGRSDADLGYQRSFVLKGGATPWDTYTYLGKLLDDWAIDGTVATIDSTRYFIYSCQDSGMQSLCMAQLTSPSTIGTVTAISNPTNDWEQEEDQLPVNEGPAVLQRNGKTFIAFSASYCWTDKYQLGLLTLGDGKDPLGSDAWTKTGPVFSSANGNYGTGHNGFFTSPDGTEYWNVYHATSATEGACDGNRYTMASVINWNADGTPDFGTAPALSATLTGPSGE